MMGDANSQPTLYYNISLEDFVPQDHPLRSIRPLIDTKEIRRICRDLYAPIGRPSIPPEQLFLALVAGYLLGFRLFALLQSATTFLVVVFVFGVPMSGNPLTAFAALLLLGAGALVRGSRPVRPGATVRPSRLNICVFVV